MYHLLTMSDLSSDDILGLIQRAIALKNGERLQLSRPCYAANLFFENSTRTKVSFEMAERKIGMIVLPFDVGTSSVQKGENLYDTCKTLKMIGADVLVIRHPQREYYAEIESILPIVNAGDGAGNHPSQCLLDLMTIYEEFGRLDNLKVLIAGDVANSRVARSNAVALEKFGATVNFVAPVEWQDHSIGKFVDFDQYLPETDVCMMLRVQHERHDAKTTFSKESYHQQYGLTLERNQKLKDNAIIMHPAPINRDVEIADQLVESPKSRIFQQMQNGMFMRQAILEWVLKKNNLI